MAAGCMRWMLCHTLGTVCGGLSGPRIPVSRFLTRGCLPLTTRHRWSPFCTSADDTQETPAPQKKKKDPRARTTIGSVGRKIPHRQIQVIGDTGENLGVMHRSDALRLMDEQGLKLVLLTENKDPPVYCLMSGKQLHEKQMKMWEKQKAKTGPVQVKELSFSSGISGHDLATKLKQVESWLEKKHHIRITLRSARSNPSQKLDIDLEQMVEQLEVMVGFVAKPMVIRDGQAAMCILRPPSAKELSKMEKGQTSPTQKKTPPTGSTDAADEPLKH